MFPITFQNQFSAVASRRPTRIVSLVPSQTELLADMGLEERVVGITKYCIHPHQWQHQKTIIGGTKNVDIDAVMALQPDLILANKEENLQEQVEALAQFCPVYVSDVHDLNTALEMILQIGLLVQSLMQAESVVHEIVLSFENMDREIKASLQNQKLAYLIWRKPYMVAGGDTFINDMLQRCGFRNAFENTTRYPVVTIKDLQQSNPHILFLSSEPFPFQQKHIDELKIHLPKTKMLLVDGEMFSWHGSHLLRAPVYFTTLLKQISTSELF